MKNNFFKKVFDKGPPKGGQPLKNWKTFISKNIFEHLLDLFLALDGPFELVPFALSQASPASTNNIIVFYFKGEL